MISYKQGNLLEVTEGIIVHGCNAQGRMGSGVALAVRHKYPGAYEKYVQDLQTEAVELGMVSWYRPTSCLYIASAITQYKYGYDGHKYVNYDALTECFAEVLERAKVEGLDVHMPLIGAGLGGGTWSEISELINSLDPDNKVSMTCWMLK